MLRDRDTSEPKNGVLNERLYALQDANFNVVALADTGGTIQERYLYSAYGTPSVSTGTFGSRGTSAYGWEYRYTARRYDLATGLYYYRRRPYHHELGRFLSRDPIGYGAGDTNLYRYLGNRPVSAVDPLGLEMFRFFEGRPRLGPVTLPPPAPLPPAPSVLDVLGVFPDVGLFAAPPLAELPIHVSVAPVAEFHSVAPLAGFDLLGLGGLGAGDFRFDLALPPAPRRQPPLLCFICEEGNAKLVLGFDSEGYHLYGEGGQVESIEQFYGFWHHYDQWEEQSNWKYVTRAPPANLSIMVWRMAAPPSDPHTVVTFEGGREIIYPGGGATSRDMANQAGLLTGLYGGARCIRLGRGAGPPVRLGNFGGEGRTPAPTGWKPPPGSPAAPGGMADTITGKPSSTQWSPVKPDPGGGIYPLKGDLPWYVPPGTRGE